jgi:hypothetical protein
MVYTKITQIEIDMQTVAFEHVVQSMNDLSDEYQCIEQEDL